MLEKCLSCQRWTAVQRVDCHSSSYFRFWIMESKCSRCGIRCPPEPPPFVADLQQSSSGPQRCADDWQLAREEALICNCSKWVYTVYFSSSVCWCLHAEVFRFWWWLWWWWWCWWSIPGRCKDEVYCCIDIFTGSGVCTYLCGYWQFGWSSRLVWPASI